MDTQKFEIRSIGTAVAEKGVFGIQVSEQHRKALVELEGWSHVQIIWWGHLLDKPEYREGFLTCPKPYSRGPEEVGVFATRSPARPNPLSLTTAQVISVNIGSGLIVVNYLDAEDGTPIIDIKPYVPAIDKVNRAGYPAWADEWPEFYEDSASFDWSAVFENAR